MKLKGNRPPGRPTAKWKQQKEGKEEQKKKIEEKEAETEDGDVVRFGC